MISTFVRSKEEKEENDDEEELQSKRRMDEYKDEHKRGEGNRHNMGWNLGDKLTYEIIINNWYHEIIWF